MAEDTSQPKPQESPKKQTSDKAESSAAQMDAQLQENVEFAVKLPIPGESSFWLLEPDSGGGLGKKGLLSFLKRKDLTDEEMIELRQEAEKAPGQARVKVHLLMKKNASSPSLMALSAFCTYRLVKNSANRKTAMEGLKSASKEAAMVLAKDAISLYNVENFFTIYFEYLGKLKRFQISTYKTVRESGKYQGSKQKLATAIKLCDSMLEDKNRAFKVLSQIKGKFKSSSYTAVWSFSNIQMAAKKVENNEYKAICGPAEAREILIYTLALTEIFSRIQFLAPLVDKILTFVPESTTALLLRKSAIMVTRAFTQLNVAVQEGDMERMRTIGKQIYTMTLENINRIADQPIKQSFEADPYFQMSRMAILTFGAFEAKEQREIIQRSLAAMNKVAKIDITKNHVYTETAQNMAAKLNNLLSEGPN